METLTIESAQESKKITDNFYLNHLQRSIASRASKGYSWIDVLKTSYIPIGNKSSRVCPFNEKVQRELESLGFRVKPIEALNENGETVSITSHTLKKKQKENPDYNPELKYRISW